MISVNGMEAFDINFSTMNGERYCGVLNSKVLPYFQEVGNAWKIFQQDGAPPHFCLDARRYLDHNLPRGWIGRRGPIEWPPRSPDLTPCDFFLWGILQEKVYARSPTWKIQLARMLEEEIGNLPQIMFVHAYDSFYQRCQLCVSNDGYYFENELK